MSVDPDPATPPEPAQPPPVREKQSMPQAKRRYKRGNEPDTPGDVPAAYRPRPEGEDRAAALPDEQVADEIEALNARLRTLSAQREAAQQSNAAESRGAKYFRLARKQSPPPTPRDPSAPAAAPGPVAASPGAASPRTAPAPGPAGPVTLPTPPAIHYAPWHDTAWHPGWLVASAGMLVLGLLAFFLGRASNRPLVIKEVALTPAPTWSAADIAQLDRIIATDRSGDLGEAFQQANRLNRVLGTREGLSLYSAGLQARAGGINNAEADLVRSVNAYAPPFTNAAVQDRLGFVYARRRDFKSAADCFAAAVASNPFDPAAFYHWGEALRRGGKLADAVDKFQAALLRLPPEGPETSGLRECAALRLRLTLIELGNDAGLKPTLDQQLRLPVPSVYWLVTAIAYDLQHNDPASAAAMVDRAKVVAQPTEFDLLCNDYFLRVLATHAPGVDLHAPELTRERRARLDASHAYFIDP